jgi:large subunit ribosomal protein L23
MALFAKNKTEKKEEKKVVAPKKAAVKKVTKSPVTINARKISTEAAKIIVRPHITEKSGALSQVGVYTFEVAKSANSKQISEAVEAIYKVVPAKVSLAPIHSKAKNYRGIPGGRSASGKKAYVYLKKGDSIEFI